MCIMKKLNDALRNALCTKLTEEDIPKAWEIGGQGGRKITCKEKGAGCGKAGGFASQVYMET